MTLMRFANSNSYTLFRIFVVENAFGIMSKNVQTVISLVEGVVQTHWTSYVVFVSKDVHLGFEPTIVRLARPFQGRYSIHNIYVDLYRLLWLPTLYISPYTLKYIKCHSNANLGVYFTLLYMH